MSFRLEIQDVNIQPKKDQILYLDAPEDDDFKYRKLIIPKWVMQIEIDYVKIFCERWTEVQKVIQ